jgi:hypothetical protein
MMKENVRILQMFYFANELANHKQSSIEILIDIPCSWHDNTTDPLRGRRKGIPACKHYSSNMAFSIGCWLIIDRSHAMPVRLGGAMWRRSLSLWWWMTNQQESCIFPPSFVLQVPLCIATWRHSANFQPQPPTDNKLPLYYLVCIVGPLTYILIWLVISIFSPVCPCFSL